MKVLLGTGIVLAATVIGSCGAKADDRVIYGDDNRKDLYDPTVDEDLLGFAKSTAILIEDSKLDRTKMAGKVKLPIKTFKESEKLCADEPFGKQLNPGFCSGFLVGPDLFATAGHCITDQSDCAKTSMIFDFALNSQDQDLSTVEEHQVFHCKSIVKHMVDPTTAGADFAIVKLDRAVEGRSPLAIRRVGDVDVGVAIAVVGSPSGLPTKISDGAKVRKNTKTAPYFVANLDTYGGNSGSAVFNMVTGEVEGILVRGENDFDYDSTKKCFRSHHCTDAGCRGEDVTKAAVFKRWVP